MHKRTFIKSAALTAVGASFGLDALASLFEAKKNLSSEALAADDAFWKQIRDQYLLKPDYINLENGYYNFVPKPILDKYLQHIRDVNYQGSYYMRTVQFDNKKRIAARLAKIAGCDADELIITRNTTESLDMIIGGRSWSAGDEAVMAIQDYGAMLDMFEQISKRYGVVLKKISVPNIPVSDAEIVSVYEQAITPKTKLLMVCHMVNITGQILPVKKICDMAHSKGVDVMVDGAHAFAHFQYNIRDLNCDYYGTSLHKWLSVPLGAGFLYVKKGKAGNIWPLLGDGNKDMNDINRLNHTGTHPCATDLAIEDAIDYYNMIGAERKEARLKWLQQYWTSKVSTIPNIVLNTPPDRACGIANVGIKGIKPADMAKRLLDEHRVFTVAIDYANVQGCRIAPNLYTTTAELDEFVAALKKMAT
ncbi:MAG TPA: aminotransferase class V-fold PLP-dependent enzyme [Chitinophagaceae bacterium]|nr:aminotransferase class V-fold PLP-dependent enzyme [Chitinophagaceae bacterium]